MWAASVTNQWIDLKSVMHTTWLDYLGNPPNTSNMWSLLGDKFIYDHVMANIASDNEEFINDHRLSPSQFDDLRKIIEPHLTETFLSPAFRLSLTLWYLSCGSRKGYPYYIADLPYTKEILTDVLNAISEVLRTEVLPEPSIDDLVKYAIDFEKLWNFPNCIGAVARRSITCKRKFIGSSYYHVQFLSICDPYYRFIYPPVYLNMESTIFMHPPTHPIINIMEDINVEGTPDLKQNLPIVVVGEPIFPGVPKLLQPLKTEDREIDELFYNWRQERAMCAADIALAILFERWNIFKAPLLFGDDAFIHRILNCAVILHNWLISQEKDLPLHQKHYMPNDVFHDHDKNAVARREDWRKFTTTPIITKMSGQPTISKNCDTTSQFIQYFQFDGFIPSQLETLLVEELEIYVTRWKENDPQYEAATKLIAERMGQ